jgi:hypothetical protein
MDGNDQIIPYLREKHPGAFEGWDEFEFEFTGRQRKDESPSLLVSLYNDAKNPGYAVVKLHATFLIWLDQDGNEQIHVGGFELAANFDMAHYPGDVKS